MAEVTQEVNIEILEKLSDGKYKKKNPATRAEVVKFADGIQLRITDPTMYCKHLME